MKRKHKKRAKPSRPAEQEQFIFGRKKRLKPIRREDIYDAKHIFEQVDRVIKLLKNFKHNKKLGIKHDMGAVLWGGGGMGKSLFTRYIAQESKAHFIDAREFPVQVKSRVHIWQPEDITNLFDLSYKLVKKSGRPVILFIDQFDDWLTVRGAVKDQLEIELQGISGEREGVFLIVTAQDPPFKFGGTLFRRGRIGIHIAFGEEVDLRQQEKLLKGFLSRHPHDASIDLKGALAVLSRRPSPATIEYCVAEAYELADDILKRRYGHSSRKPKITEDNLLEVFLRQSLGSPSGHEPSEKDKLITAIHEVGHAVVGRFLGMPVRFVSVVPGLTSSGFVFVSDDEHATHTYLYEIRNFIATCYGSIAVMKMLNVQPMVNTWHDLESASEHAFRLVMSYAGYRESMNGRYGLLIPEVPGDDEDSGADYKSISRILDTPDLREKLTDDVRRIVKAEERRANSIVRLCGKSLIRKVAEALLKKPHGVMLQKELDFLLEPKLCKYHRERKVRDLIKE